MFTSENEKGRRALKTTLIYVCISLLCALFGGVYEVYSHGVYSFDMIYAFVYPLAMGALPFAALASLSLREPSLWASRLYHWGIAALTVGSVIRGVLEIYGTTCALCFWYLPTGIIFTVAGIFLYVTRLLRL